MHASSSVILIPVRHFRETDEVYTHPSFPPSRERRGLHFNEEISCQSILKRQLVLQMGVTILLGKTSQRPCNLPIGSAEDTYVCREEINDHFLLL